MLGNKEDDYSETHRLIKIFISINGSVLTIVLLVMSLKMMRRLKYRFHGLYTDYGKKLWCILIV